MKKLLLAITALNSVLLLIIIKNLKFMAKTLDETLEKVTETNTVADSLIVVTTDIKAKLDEALSGVSLPPGVQEKIDAIWQAAEDQRVEIADAILANTPEGGGGEEPPAEGKK